MLSLLRTQVGARADPRSGAGYALKPLCGDASACGGVALRRQLGRLLRAIRLPQPPPLARRRSFGSHFRCLREPPCRIGERSFPRLEPRWLRNITPSRCSAISAARAHEHSFADETLDSFREFVAAAFEM
jgi:hypothetical protein